eukprot:TRINITY_DN759_c0_g1_i13.p1 TRINITY_DN759_c0_g1~~TRINITY_DN759_c0_g1_i13.p1  ORF type:complete len:822 (+),score=153.15 TRINITY_DN759_c0_g1_i13:1258-3723(+)
MANLQYLQLDDNMLTGTVPTFSTVSQLQRLQLTNNKLSGSLPNLALPFLTFLNVEGNQLSGVIPSLSGLARIQYLFLGKNQFQGQIPLLQQFNLVQLILQDNRKLTGTIPSFELPSLVSLQLDGNGLTGTIPEMTSFQYPKLLDLYLDDNNLTGVVPNLQMESLSNMRLQRNQLSGQLPSFSSLTMAKSIDVSHNKIEGTLPSLTSCQQLLSLDVSHNQIEAVSEQELARLEVLTLSDNKLSSSLPDLKTPNLVELSLAFNAELRHPLPAWNSLVNLQKLDLYESRNMIGALPAGMENYTLIAEVNTLRTNMTAEPGKLLPSTLKPSDIYQIKNSADKFQCPVITVVNSKVLRPIIEIESSYHNYSLCKCLPGHIGASNVCVQCPSDCDCPDGVTMKKCYASPSVRDVKSVVPCANPESCSLAVGSIFNTKSTQDGIKECSAGYEDRICSKCASGYGPLGRTCNECKDVSIYLYPVFLPIGFMVFIYYLYKTETSGSGRIRIIMFHMQTMSIISSVLQASESADRAIDFASSIGSIQLPNLACLMDTTTAIDPLIFSYSRILALVVAGLVLYVVLSKEYKTKVIFICLNLLYFIYYSITREVFGVFGCTLYDDSTEDWYLNSYPWVRCQPYSSEYTDMLAVSIVVFILFTLGFPCFMYYVLFKTKESDYEVTTARYGFLYLPYKTKFRYWELVIITRRVLFAMVISVIPYDEPHALLLALVIIIQTSMWIQQRYQPYRDVTENRMELFSLYIIFVSFFLALIGTLLEQQLWVSAVMIAINVTTVFVFISLSLFPMLQTYLVSRGILSPPSARNSTTELSAI